MHVEKIETLRDEDRALCAAFRRAKGFEPARRMTSCGLGWFQEYARDQGGLSAGDAEALCQRVYFDEHPAEASLYAFISAAAAPVRGTEALAKLREAYGFSVEDSRKAVMNATGGVAAWATYDGGFSLRLLRRGEDVGYWP